MRRNVERPVTCPKIKPSATLKTSVTQICKNLRNHDGSFSCLQRRGHTLPSPPILNCVRLHRSLIGLGISPPRASPLASTPGRLPPPAPAAKVRPFRVSCGPSAQGMKREAGALCAKRSKAGAAPATVSERTSDGESPLCCGTGRRRPEARLGACRSPARRPARIDFPGGSRWARPDRVPWRMSPACRSVSFFPCVVASPRT